MKKLLTLAVAGCMVLGSFGSAAAVDVKVKGQWSFHYGYYTNGEFTEKKDTGSHADRVRMRQRVRTQVQFIADENLSAMLNLEGNMQWGNKDGGGLDADQAAFVIKHAYLDWTLPNTNVKTRMGMQGLRLPGAVAGNVVMDADVAGIAVSSQLTPELGLTAFWARPYDAGYADGQNDGKNSYDDMDMFGFILPIKTDVVRLSPWAMFALIGKDSEYVTGEGRFGATPGRYADRQAYDQSKVDSSMLGWWAGTSLELPILDPFFVKMDAMLGGIDTGHTESDTWGYYLAAEMGHKFSFGSLSALGWYASGEKDSDEKGHTMPMVSDDTGFYMTSYGFAGGRSRAFDCALSSNGLGMWGIGLKLADVAFVDNLKHTLQVTYMGGTNKGDSAGRRSMRDGGVQSYLMSSDRAWEVDLLNSYKVNDNLDLYLDFSYLALDLGDHWRDKNGTEGSFATMVGVSYTF